MEDFIRIMNKLYDTMFLSNDTYKDFISNVCLIDDLIITLCIFIILVLLYIIAGVLDNYKLIIKEYEKILNILKKNKK